MKITTRQHKHIINEEPNRESGAQLELELEPSGLWDMRAEFLQLHPGAPSSITISDFKELHRRAYKESLRVARDESAMAALGMPGGPRSSDELNDLIMKLMARNSGVDI